MTLQLLLTHTVKICFATLVVVVPLVPLHFLQLGEGVGASVIRFFPMIPCLVASVAWLVSCRADCRNCWGPLALLVGFHTIVLVFGALISVHPILSLTKVVWYVVTGEVLLLVAASCLARKTDIVMVLKLTAGVAGVVGAAAVLEGLGPQNPLIPLVFNDDNSLMMRFSSIAEGQALSTIGNPNPLGSYLVLCFPFAFALTKTSRARVGRVLWIVVVLMIVGGLIMSFSRGAWIAFLAACALMAFPCRWWRVAGLSILAPIALVIGSGSGVFGEGRVGGSYDEWVNGWRTDHRIQSIQLATQVWATRPLLGVGVGTYMDHALPLGSENDTPDNAYLLRLAESGLAGLILQLTILIFIAGVLLRCLVMTELYPPVSPSHGDLIDKWFARAFVASAGSFLVSMATWDAPYFPLTRVVFSLVAGLGVAYVHATHGSLAAKKQGLEDTQANSLPHEQEAAL